MPKAEGSYLELYKKFNDRENALLLIDIINGIRYLHQKGIVHLDLKLENVLIFKENGKYIAKLCDFGFSKELEKGEPMELEKPVGTPYYMDPELIKTKICSKESDIFSLGRLIKIVLGKSVLVWQIISVREMMKS